MNLRGDVLEALPAFIAVERILSPVSHEEVGKAVVVVIPGANSLRPALPFEAQGFAYVTKLAAAFVVVHAAGRARSRDDKDVSEPVVVIVDERHAAAGCLDDEPLGSAAAVG